MGKINKTSFRAYAAWNYDKEEQDLDEQSKKGWQLVKGGCFHSRFIQDESVTYRYRIDFNPTILKSREEKERYISFFEDQGWEFVNVTFNGWSYFRKLVRSEVLESEYEIYSDQESYYGMLSRWIRVGWVAVIFELVAALVYILHFLEDHEAVFIVGPIAFLAMAAWIGNGIRRMKEKLDQRTTN
ncbi:DUF2812 domain-containing protein [Eubacteriaceae bacterium ES3]|nr:DUF2812 domain-containing protein [Eubacteriaceae bacterium ES3]